MSQRNDGEMETDRMEEAYKKTERYQMNYMRRMTKPHTKFISSNVNDMLAHNDYELLRFFFLLPFFHSCMAFFILQFFDGFCISGFTCTSNNGIHFAVYTKTQHNKNIE